MEEEELSILEERCVHMDIFMYIFYSFIIGAQPSESHISACFSRTLFLLRHR